jgi:hypothetical protein
MDMRTAISNMDMRTGIIRIFEWLCLFGVYLATTIGVVVGGLAGGLLFAVIGGVDVFGIRLCYWWRAYTFGYRRQLAPAGRNRGEARRRIYTAASRGAAHLTFPPQFTAVAIKASAPTPAAWRYSPRSAAPHRGYAAANVLCA